MDTEQFQAIARVFAKAQKSQATHSGCCEILEKLARHLNTAQKKLFAENFLTLLRPALAVEKAASAHAVDRLVAFAATFSVQTNLTVPTATKAEPFSLWVLHRVLLWHEARSKAVRYRVTQLIALLLKLLPEGTDIPEKLWIALEQALLRRAHDRVAPVRVEAVRGLSRLQNPGDEADRVTGLLLRLLQQDPLPDVRRAVVCEVALARHTMQQVLARLRDKDASVREAVYRIVEKKLDVKYLRAKYRVQLVREGLRDRSEMVRRAAVAICKQWLQNRSGMEQSSAVALVELVELLDIDKGEQHTEAAELLVEHLLDAQIVSVEPQDVALFEPDASSSSILVWRMQAQRLHEKQQWAQLDALLPDVPRYARMLKAAAESERTGTVTQLLQLARFLDVADEASRLMLSALLRGLLPTLRNADLQVPLVLAALRVLHADADDCNRIVFEALSDVMQPIDLSEQTLTPEVLAAQDAHLEDLETRIAQLERSTSKEARKELEACTKERDELEAQQLAHAEALNTAWLRALRVAEEHLRFTPLDLRDASIAELKQRLIRRVLLWGGANAAVRQAALRLLGLYALRDVTVARDELPLLMHALAHEEEFVQEAVLRALFDLLARFGAALFEGGNESRQADLMDALYAQLDADDVVLRSIVVEGFTKLLYTRQLSDQRVLGVLVLMYLNPATQQEDPRLQQMLAAFLPAFAYSHGQNQRLVASVLPRVLRAWQSAQGVKSPLSGISPTTVLKFLLSLTDPRLMRAYWSERPHALALLEVPLALHHELATRLIDDVLLGPAQRGVTSLAESSFALPLLRELRSMAYDVTTAESSASLKALLDGGLTKAVQICKTQNKLKAAAEELERVLPELRALLDKADAVATETGIQTPVRPQVSTPEPTRIRGNDASPELDEALTRTAKKSRVLIDRRVAHTVPIPLHLDEAEAPDAVDADDDAHADDKETAVEGASTQPESSLPEHSEPAPPTAPSRKRGHTAAAPDEAPARAKKPRRAASREEENQPPRGSKSSESGASAGGEEKKRGRGATTTRSSKRTPTE